MEWITAASPTECSGIIAPSGEWSLKIPLDKCTAVVAEASVADVSCGSVVAIGCIDNFRRGIAVTYATVRSLLIVDNVELGSSECAACACVFYTAEEVFQHVMASVLHITVLGRRAHVTSRSELSFSFCYFESSELFKPMIRTTLTLSTLQLAVMRGRFVDVEDSLLTRSMESVEVVRRMYGSRISRRCTCCSRDALDVVDQVHHAYDMMQCLVSFGYDVRVCECRSPMLRFAVRIFPTV